MSWTSIRQYRVSSLTFGFRDQSVLFQMFFNPLSSHSNPVPKTKGIKDLRRLELAVVNPEVDFDVFDVDGQKTNVPGLDGFGAILPLSEVMRLYLCKLVKLIEAPLEF